MKTLQIPRLLFISCLLFSLIGCASSPKMLFDKPGMTAEEFNRDKYECAQPSRTSWSGGGTGGLGAFMIISAESNANKQAAEFFKMCMEARGYTGHEVSDEDFEKQKSSPFKAILKQIGKENVDRCNRDVFKLIFMKSACKITEITLEQLSDKSMIAENEKAAFSLYRLEILGSGNKLIEAARNSENLNEKEEGIVFERIFQQSEQSALDLFEGKKTWGEYNRKRKELAQNHQAELNRISNNK